MVFVGACHWFPIHLYQLKQLNPVQILRISWFPAKKSRSKWLAKAQNLGIESPEFPIDFPFTFPGFPIEFPMFFHIFLAFSEFHHPFFMDFPWNFPCFSIDFPPLTVDFPAKTAMAKALRPQRPPIQRMLPQAPHGTALGGDLCQGAWLPRESYGYVLWK